MSEDKSSLDMSFEKSAAGISEIPELTSLLYDLDLMPEQIVSDGGKLRLILIVGHFKAFKSRLENERHVEMVGKEEVNK